MAGFYGLEVRIVDASSRDAMDRLKSPATLAVVASQDALSGLDWRRIQVALRRPKKPDVPMLVFAVAARQPSRKLRLWSAGTISECAPFGHAVLSTGLAVAWAGTLSGTLAGMELPAVASPGCELRLERSSKAQTVLVARGATGTSPVLVRVRSGEAEVFFAPLMEQFDCGWAGKPSALPKVFSHLAPFIFFLRYVAGDCGWHLDRPYANLTIDDPWLTQPYGNLDYPALLSEMERHNFHTTIAFIPWNFDRSEPDVVALFRAHPDRFSICIHGNNHAHREFGDYTVNSLRQQASDVRQSVARMERFHELTGLPYDRFMVFPHDIAPQETFATLRRCGFLGTANLLNVPLGAVFPADPAFLLRPYTVAYARFLSMSRYPAATGPVEIAIRLFLGNPLLIYSHQSLFADGIGAFNKDADLINRLQPDMRWTSLGEIARHLHLVRRREDGGFDVWMFSDRMELENPTDHGAVFHVRREFDPTQPAPMLSVDGSPGVFERSGNLLALSLFIPARQHRSLAVTCKDATDLSHEPVGHKGLYESVLRRVSDFRDLELSRVGWGRNISHAYYENHLDSAELWLERRWKLGIICLGLVVAAAWRLRRQAAKRPAKGASEPA